MRVGELFADEPDHWELRGDHALWRQLASDLADVEAPSERLEFERLLENAFWEATGHSLALSTQVLVKRFAEDGGSRGGISAPYWRYQLFPRIIERYKAAMR
ncbi:hypothetical protein [Tropicimonas sp. IMCC6043]|uniref:hypothetical protein n=1 Tax=Tropicimonas sp. IMCC6043 TaxID=2510645 RepID=UPI00101C96E5|nr:hypothetical protein [Tropicimonas sp. IMCC6043]RYH11146.1 hypothetical protein EU800_04605 [Tropicimonas sp. IMCC6043]